MKPYRGASKRAWLFLLLSVPFGVSVHAADSGSAVFQSGLCNACHTIGGGRLVGPDLAGINQRRPRDWLVDFIRSPQTLIRGGDTYAVALVAEYNGILMPDAPVSEDEILLILGYIETESSVTSSGEPAPVVERVPASAIRPTPAGVREELREKLREGVREEVTAVAADTEKQAVDTQAQVTLGQKLFQGTVRFENGGPTCNACHDLANDAVIGGGILAKALTDVFSRMGGAGVQAILGRPPFPVMEAAYADQPLTEGEISALVAVLRHTAETNARHMPRDYGLGLFTSGIAGAVLVFGSCSLIWRGRKKGSVNQSIYDRQIKSS